MKRIIRIISAIVFATIARSSVVRAENAPPRGSFSGGGYTIEIGSEGDYVGSDRSRRRIVIPRSQHRYNGQTSEWTNEGYIYRVTGIGNSLAESKVKPFKLYEPSDSTDYRKAALTIINPSGRIVFYKILTNSRYGKR